MIGYSPKFPLQIDNYVGAYAVNTELKDVIRQNFKNLMLTAQGERVMDINFGAGLRHYLFEQNHGQLQSSIAEKVREQTQKYMPFISLTSVDFNTSTVAGNVEDHILDISIKYSISGLDENASVLISAAADSL